MRLYLLIILLSLTNLFYGQLLRPDNRLFRPDTSKRVNFLVLPAVFTSPETSWAFGASASMSFKTSHKNDSLTRTSMIQAVGIYTINKQYIAGIDATIYFPKETYILYASIGYTYFPDKFWGLGPDTRNSDIERYSTNQLGFAAHLKRRVWKRLFTGIIADVKRVYDIRYWAHSNLDTNAIPGKKPYTLTGLGFSIGYDTRNNAFFPTKGYFVQSQFTGYTDILGSNHNYTKWFIEGRYYRQLHPKVISATQIYGITNTGDVPFKSMAMLGGTDNLRGYYQGRYRDKVYISLVTELRFPVFERIGFAVFGGTGNVSSSLPAFDPSSLKYSFGAGIRLAVRPNDRLNIRIDYGYADKYNKGLYFTLGEAF